MISAAMNAAHSTTRPIGYHSRAASCPFGDGDAPSGLRKQ